MNHLTDTIAAICTPHGRAGLSVIRVSGPEAINVTSKIARLFGKKSLTEIEGFRATYGEVVFEDKVIDQVVFLVFKTPKSFTGENVVEISCHGNPLICQKILNALFANGARQAGPGEFTRQAFANNKLDLIQAQAIHELVMANNSVAINKSLDKLRLGLSTEIKNILTQAFSLLAVLEASFEFSEEENSDFASLAEQELSKLEELAHKIKLSLDLDSSRQAEVKLVIIGVPNAGKSTLFNNLVGHERAIVSSVAGTTRDFIESNLCHKGEVWKLVDTAGIRQTSDKIEEVGVKRAHEQAESSDLIIFVFDASLDPNTSGLQKELLEEFKTNFGRKTVFVANKTDLCHSLEFLKQEIIGIQWVETDWNNKSALENLKERLLDKINEIKGSQDSLFMLSEVQKNICRNFIDVLERFRLDLQAGVGYELLANNLTQGTKILGNLTSRDANNSVYDQVFSKFCIGK